VNFLVSLNEDAAKFGCLMTCSIKRIMWGYDMKSQEILNRKMEPKKLGFQRFNTGNTGINKHDAGGTSDISGTSVGTRNPLTEQWREMIKQRGPYYFFITLTFSMRTGFEARCQYANYLLHQFNRRVFRHSYKKRNKFVEGFAFFEDHPSQCTDNKPHIHLLVEYNEVFDKKSVDEYKDMFLNAAYEVKNAWNKHVFSKKCIVFGAAGHDVGLIKYCTKVMWDKTITDMKPLCINGLSDNPLLSHSF